MTNPHASRNLLRCLGLSAVLSLGLVAAAPAQAPAQAPAAAATAATDPALANMAPDSAAQPGAAAYQQPSAAAYPQQPPAPIVRNQPAAAIAAAPSADAPPDDAATEAQVADGEQALDDASTTAEQPPPALPDYDQPEAPGDNYMWTPGYWGYAPAGYYWVPGAWIVPPFYGGLWTPGYWGFYGGLYRFHPGYWGLHVGFYGGVNYGFGYIGTGYFGGYWRGNAFLYNRAVTNVGVGVSVTNVYNRTVVYNGHTYGPQPTSRVSYNGGRAGIAVTPRPAELAAMHEPHTAPLPGQTRLNQMAAANPQAAFSANHGHPPLAAQQHPLGVGRPIAGNQAAFQSRPLPQQAQRNQPQRRPAPQGPQFRSAPHSPQASAHFGKP